MSRNPPAPRANRIHSGPRDQILPRGPRVVPPAWRQQRQEQVVRAHETRVSMPSTSHKRLEPKPGGAILVENLPFDTTAHEVADLFKSTIGPLADSYLLYNSQGNPKGMAIVEFERASHAQEARKVYHGQIIDSTRPLRIRIIIDSDDKYTEPSSLSSRLNPNSVVPQSHAGPPEIESQKYLQPYGKTRGKPSSTQHSQARGQSTSLTDRIGPAVHSANGQSRYQPPMFMGVNGMGVTATYQYPFATELPYQYSYPVPPAQPHAPRPARGHRMKKGPKRTAKQLERLAMSGTGQRRKTKTAAELDEEMDIYRREGKFSLVMG